MKTIKRLFIIIFALACLAFTAVAFCGCGLFGDDDSGESSTPTIDEYTDPYGYSRPKNVWITDCVVLSNATYKEYAHISDRFENDLFGDSGASGLINSELAQRGNEELWQESYGTSRLDGCFVYYVYGYGYEKDFYDIRTSFQFRHVEGYDITYNPDFVSFSDVSFKGDYISFKLKENDYDDYDKYEFSVNLGQNFDYNPAVKPEEQIRIVQTAIYIPFSIDNIDDINGSLYFDIEIDVPLLSKNKDSYVGGHSVYMDLNRIHDGMATAQVEGFSVKYATEEDCPDGDVDGAEFSDSPDFDGGKINYMIIDFSLTVTNDNDGSSTLNTLIRVPESQSLNVRLISAPTGNLREIVENGKTYIDASFIIPENKDDQKDVQIVIRLTPRDSFLTDMEFYFNSDDGKIQGLLYNVFRFNAGNPVLKYELSEDEESYAVVGVWDEDVTEISIPDTYNELPVTSVSMKFSELKRLERLVIGNNVERIVHNDAFNGCSSLSYVSIGGSMTSIKQALFKDCKNLAAVKLADGIERIEYGAFNGCSSLTSIVMPNSVTYIGNSAFSGCSSLISATLPNGITRINSGTFSGCSSLTSIDIPDSVTIIDSNSFNGCSSLTSITIPENVTYVWSSAFEGCSNLKTVYWNATTWESVDSSFGRFFKNCNQLTSAVIGDNVTIIPKSLFYQCSSLMSVTIGNNVTSIGEAAFLGCSNLTSIVLPNSVISIGDGAFYDCSGLKSINLPNSVVSIESCAFYGCSNLISISMPNGVTSIGYGTFARCSSLTSVTIPNSVTSIGYEAFIGCSSLIDIMLPNSITNIGYSAFERCGSLKSITIPNGVTSIENSTFRDCSSLISVVIPESVTSIDNYAFNGCSSLRSIEIPNSVTKIGYYTFVGCFNLKTLKFAGTMQQWEAIDKDTSWKSSINTIICTDGEVRV